MPRLLNGLLAVLLLLPVAGQGLVHADEIDQETAGRTIKTLLESDPKTNVREVWLLSQSFEKIGKSAIAPLNKAYATAQPAQQLAIGRALILLDDHTRGMTQLKTLVADDKVSAILRAAALDVIGLDGELEEAEWLEDLIDTTFEPMVKLAMARALWDLNYTSKAKGRDVMLEYMNSTDPDLRAEGALALGHIGVPEAKSILNELRREPTEQGRRAALILRIFQYQEAEERALSEPIEPAATPGTDPEAAAPPITPIEADMDKPWPLLDEIRSVLQRYYVDKAKVDSANFEDGAAVGLTRALDPYTNYMSPSANAKLMEGLDPSYGGVGAYVFNDVENATRFTISRPIYGGPAYTTGLLAGDIVTAIDGTPTEGLTVNDCVRLLKGPPATPVVVSILRRGWTKAREFTLTRARITIPTTAFDILPGNIGFLQILNFSEETATEVGRVLDQFEQQEVEAIVIDLRYNSGGYLRSAVQIASHFLPRGKVVVTERGRPDVYRGEVHKSMGSGRLRRQVPVRILINQGTASAAEILAGALRDHGRARLVGTMTYGKGLAQISLPLTSRAGETFTDTKRTAAVARAGDEYKDFNHNGRWDPSEPFTSTPKPNGRYDPDEKFTDQNGNGKWDAGEPFTDVDGNKTWTPGEVFEDKNKNGRWDPGGAIKLTIAKYYTPNKFNPQREVKVVDGKLKVVGGIEPHVEAKPLALDFWEIQAQRKIEGSGKVREYVLKLFDADLELMTKVARSDSSSTKAYPDFDAFYEGLDTKLDRDAVRWLVRWNARRIMGDRLGRELVGDVVDDPVLQDALKDVLESLDKRLGDIEGLRFLAK